MGVEDIFEGIVKIDLEGLAELDKIAEAQAKKLKKIQDDRAKKGGVFAPSTGQLPKAIEKQREKELSTRIQKLQKEGKIITGGQAPIQKESSFQKAVDKAVAKSTAKASKLGGKKFSTGQINTVASFGKNPVSFMSNMFIKQLPILGGILAVKEIVQFIIGELLKPGGPLDVRFRDIVSTLMDAFREKQVVQSIVAGFTQVILTTRSGMTNPRNAYNTFELANNDRITLEEDFSVRVLKIN